MRARDGNEMLVSTFFSVRSRQGGGGHEKAYVLYARVYVENYARPLSDLPGNDCFRLKNSRQKSSQWIFIRIRSSYTRVLVEHFPQK